MIILKYYTQKRKKRLAWSSTSLKSSLLPLPLPDQSPSLTLMYSICLITMQRAVLAHTYWRCASAGHASKSWHMLIHWLFAITWWGGYHCPPSYRGRNWSPEMTVICPQSLQWSVTELVPHPDSIAPESTLVASTPCPLLDVLLLLSLPFLCHYTMTFLSPLPHWDRSCPRWISTCNIHPTLGSLVQLLNWSLFNCTSPTKWIF